MAFHRKLFDVHRQMVKRCEDPSNPDYPNYGGRGIKVCEEWQDFRTFTEWALSNGYQPGLSIDRENTNSGYEPSNCRWATVLQQARNARRVVMIEFNGQTRPLVEWAEIVGISQRTLKMRRKLGWSVERMLTVRPVKGRNQYA